MSDEAAVALEDYARVLAASDAAEAITDPNDPGRVRGVHVCGARLDAPATEPDLEDFARGLVARAAGAGLGWE